MKSKWILTLLTGLLLVLPVLATAQVQLDPRDSLILESKTVAPGADAGITADTSAYVYQKVYITNKDSLTALTLALKETSLSGGAYATLGWPRNLQPSGNSGVVSLLTATLNGSKIFFGARYHSNSPDSFLIAGVFDPLDPTTHEAPNATRKAIWEIKYDTVQAALGQVEFDTAFVNQNTGFTNTVPRDLPVNFVKGIFTVDVPGCLFLNCPPPNTNVLYGRPFSYDFNTDQDGSVQYSVGIGPGSIDPNTGVYTFSGQCPLGPIPIQVVATNPSTQKRCVCDFTLNIIDNAPSCTPASATVTVSHGALAANQVNTSDPDAGDVVSVAQTSGPGTTTPGGAWSYQTSCSDVAASPQTVQHQVVDGFGNCIPGPLSATCQFQLVVTNAAPSITCPGGADAIDDAQGGDPYSAQATATDADAGESLTFSLVSGPAGLTVSASGQVNWVPPAIQQDYQVCIRVTDACGATDECCYTIRVQVGQRFKICIDQIKVESQGGDVELSVKNLVQGNDPATPSSEAVGGFSFLFTYDCSCLQFLSARKGAMLVAQDWEFFTFRFGAVGNGNCGAGCPSCLIRVVAIADVNNGADHPVNNQNNQGEWVVLKFRTSSDLTLAGQCCQVNWYWFDCNDNTISDSTGNTLWIAEQLLNADGSQHSLVFPTVNVGNCDQFSGGEGKPTPKKFIIFCNGLICLPTIDEIDDRGDLNFNGVLNEIADAVLYENYFIYGPSVFTVNLAGQTAASDVNGDGQPLTVADLIRLIRIITHDANPIPRMNPAEAGVSIKLASTGSDVAVSANTVSDLGGLFLKFQVEGAVGNVSLTGAAEGMSLKSNLTGNVLSVLIYSENKDQKIAPNAGAILSLGVEGSVTLIESDAADYFGIGLPTLTKTSALPTAFGLSQNYPNPFNGRTSLTLALPVTSDYKVTVYNVTGQVVRTFEGSGVGNRNIVWDGTDMNGNAVSSGVYFFKAVAGSYSSVVKGLYLK